MDTDQMECVISVYGCTLVTTDGVFCCFHSHSDKVMYIMNVPDVKMSNGKK